MKIAEVYSVPAATARGFAWRWRSHDHARSSSMSFVIYEDCVADARQKGFSVPPPRQSAGK